MNKSKKIKHIPKHMKLPLMKNTSMSRSWLVYELENKGYTIPSKYLGGH